MAWFLQPRVEHYGERHGRPTAPLPDRLVQRAARVRLTDRLPSPRRLLRLVLGFAFAFVLSAAALLGLQNALLNFALPSLLNGRSERMRIDYTAAWMLVPGQVRVYGLSIRNQGVGDQWLITADRATGLISLDQLRERRFHASEIRAEGVSLRYRLRLDAPTRPGSEKEPVPNEGEEGEEGEVDVEAEPDTTMEPPIPGLVNPPNPNPDLMYPRAVNPWLITLDDIQADVGEIWVGDYRLLGDADATVKLSSKGPFLDLEGELSIGGMGANIGDMPVARDVTGKISLLVDGMDPSDPSSEPIQAISGRVKLDADVQDLRFLDFYLSVVPWLSLAGTGHVHVDVGLAEGRFRNGSVVEASFPKLLVRVLSNDISGEGEVRAEVGPGDDGTPRSLINVDFTDFTITPDGSTSPLVEGVGFHIDARSPDIRLDQPFTAVSVVVDLPESTIPDIALYNAYLPRGVGLSLRGGTGTVQGHLEASSVDGKASGNMDLRGDEILVHLDEMAITGDVMLHGQLQADELGTGVYDISGSTADLRRLGIIDGAHADSRDGERLWSASVNVPSGVVKVGAPLYLDAHVHMKCSDSVPFVRLFADQKSLPRWAQGLLSVQDVSGEARLQLGDETLEIGPCQIRGGGYEIDLRYRRDGPVCKGDLFARTGPLSVGIGLRPAGVEVHVFNARRWFETGSPTSP